MDILRSGYFGEMVFFQDHPDFPVPVFWYRVPPERAPLDFPTIWTSSNWDEEREPQVYGDQRKSHRWTRGDEEMRSPATDNPPVCGTLDQWQAPIDFAALLPPLQPFDVPPCCGPQAREREFGPGEAWDVEAVVFAERGDVGGEAWDADSFVEVGPLSSAGEAWGCSADVKATYSGTAGEAWDGLAPPPTVPCSACPSGIIARNWRAAFFGLTPNSCADCTSWAAGQVFSYAGFSCQASGPTMCGLSMTFGVIAGEVRLTMGFFAPPGDVYYRGTLAGWDCLSPITLLRITPDPAITNDDAAGRCHNWPTSVTVYPSY